MKGDRIVYNVNVQMTLVEGDDGQKYFASAFVNDEYPKWVLDQLQDGKDMLTPMMLDMREEALIAGLANCMFASEKIGGKKTFEALKLYIEKLERYFSEASIYTELEKPKNKKNDNTQERF